MRCTHTERSRCNSQHATCELRHYSWLQRATGNGQTGHVATRRCELQRAACPGYYVVSSMGPVVLIVCRSVTPLLGEVAPPRASNLLVRTDNTQQPTALQPTDSTTPLQSRRSGGGATRTVASSTHHGGAVAPRILSIALSESPHPTHPCAAVSATPLYRRSFLRRGDTAARRVHRCFRCERVALPV